MLTRHSFSFGDYYDPAHMGFGALRVLNESIGKPSLAQMSNATMERFVWVISGSPSDKTNSHDFLSDDLPLTRADGELSLTPSNASDRETTHCLEIWLKADEVNVPSRAYSESSAQKCGEVAHLIAGREGTNGALTIRSDSKIYVARLRGGQCIAHTLCYGQRVWVQVTRGSLELNGVRLAAGDGAAVLHENRMNLCGIDDAEALLFDLPGN